MHYEGEGNTGLKPSDLAGKLTGSSNTRSLQRVPGTKIVLTQGHRSVPDLLGTGSFLLKTGMRVSFS